jgi:hypothetical protein
MRKAPKAHKMIEKPPVAKKHPTTRLRVAPLADYGFGSQSRCSRSLDVVHE